MAEDHGNDIAMIVESVRVHMPTGRHVLLLKEIGLGRILPIWIGPWEASAIAAHLQGVEPERPLTHDLFARVLREMGARMDRVLISRLAEETFHARLVLVTADTRHEVDARPSDAIALAIRMDAPIYAASDVLDRAATLPDVADDDEVDETGATAGPGARRGRSASGALESTGEPIDTTRLDIFREFVNSLDPEGDARGGGSQS
ncbi:MAG: bifunctional nuclease family protein [Candidatus Limnocylindrales bacterium]